MTDSKDSQATPRPYTASEDTALTPTAFVDSILSACDPSNWDSKLNKGAYYRGLHDAYTAIHEIAGDYQRAMYAWTRTGAPAQGWSVPEIEKALILLLAAAKLMPRATPAPGAAGTVHNFPIEAAYVWALDGACNAAEKSLAAPRKPAVSSTHCICDTDHPLFKERGHHPHCPVSSTERGQT